MVHRVQTSSIFNAPRHLHMRFPLPWTPLLSSHEPVPSPCGNDPRCPCLPLRLCTRGHVFPQFLRPPHCDSRFPICFPSTKDIGPEGTSLSGHGGPSGVRDEPAADRTDLTEMLSLHRSCGTCPAQGQAPYSKGFLWVGRMAQWAETSAANPNDLSSISRTHVEGVE